MNSTLKLKLISFDYRLLDLWVKKIVELALKHNSKIQGPIPLPTKTKLYTVLKSPHVNKPSMEHFEKKEHRRLILISEYDSKLLSYFERMSLPASLDLRISLIG
ncbi:30S ribosomal protein S10 [Candidatus Mycoplasma haematominutum]|uniref:Small ribosomal subunit protein uS10 n=1 Tax=Candidatus Mycoplasma haematominutum 'Birmingham 1' TaxID=1116213 RepID=G8C313_9MOLU|nr:30S ribosomal protein S10 [Candidatus Mycoplasma haematominutum]CCE66711.1 ribosomal protein S10 [Candidatus Mycoplasma haematominutum 'Birmingham 1']